MKIVMVFIQTVVVIATVYRPLVWAQGDLLRTRAYGERGSREAAANVEMAPNGPVQTAPEFRSPETYEDCLLLVQQGQDFNDSQVVQLIYAATKLMEDGRIPSTKLTQIGKALERNLNINERMIINTEIYEAWSRFIQSGRTIVDNLDLARTQSQLLNAWKALLLLSFTSEDLNEFLDSMWFKNDATRYIDFTTIVSRDKTALQQIARYINSHSQVTNAEQIDDNIAAMLMQLNNEHTEHPTMELELSDAKTIIANVIKELKQIPWPDAGQVRGDMVKGFADFYPPLSYDNVQTLTADRVVYVTVDFTGPIDKSDICLIVRWNDSAKDIEAVHINDYGLSHRFKFSLPENATEYALEAFSHPNSTWHWMVGTIKIAGMQDKATSPAVEPMHPKVSNMVAALASI